MSFGKMSSAHVGKTANARPRSKTEDAATEIERLMENRGVAPLAAQAVKTGKEIGKGRFKKVHEGRLRQRCGQECADVVILRYAKKNSEVRELDILALLAGHARSASFVPEVFGVVNENTAVSVVQERAIWGTLKSCLTCVGENLQLTVPHKLNAMVQVARAMDFLKSVNLVHADLACRNVLVFRLEDDPHELVAKVSDFGLAVVLDEGAQEKYFKQPQATRWCSPETVAYGKLSCESDVWAFGMTMWELFADGTAPWANIEKRADVTQKLTKLAGEMEDLDSGSALKSEFPLSDDACPAAAYEALLSCLRVDEKARPTAAELEGTLQAIFKKEAPLRASGALVGHGNCIRFNSSVFAEVVDEDTQSDSASTEASLSDCKPVSKTLVRQLSSKVLQKMEDGVDDNERAKCEVLKDFLWSPQASQILGDKIVQQMQLELQQAGVSSDSARPEDGCCQSVVPARFIPVDSEEQTATAPIRELRLPREPTKGPGYSKCWAPAEPLSIWTLWSLAEDDALWRRDYANEAAARAALEVEGNGRLVKSTIYTSM